LYEVIKPGTILLEPGTRKLSIKHLVQISACRNHSAGNRHKKIKYIIKHNKNNEPFCKYLAKQKTNNMLVLDKTKDKHATGTWQNKRLTICWYLGKQNSNNMLVPDKTKDKHYAGT
jgi:hypothetical protein